ncbi:hypothetical protein [Capnocytophaga leadbetteri]
MATTKNNVIVKGASGKFGRQIVFSQRAGKTIMSKPPLRTAPPTTKQKEQQAKFARAAAYAKNALLDPTLKEAYTTEAKKRQDVSPYNMAMTDYLRPPQITHVDYSAYTGDASGEKIFIEAADAFKITTMKVKITAANNSTLEEGNATLVNGKWEYTTTATNTTLTGSKITLTATDRPGNTTTKEITL